MIITNIKENKISHLKEFLNLNILSDTAFLSGGAAISIIDNTHEYDDYDVFFINDYIEEYDQENNCVLGKHIPQMFDIKSDVSNYCSAVSSELIDASRKLQEQGYELVHKCPNNTTFTYKKNDMKVQLIQTIHNNIDTVIGAFDMFHCKVAYNGKDLYTSRFSIKCIIKKEIKFTYDVKNPIRTLSRVLKYHKNKNYNINVGDLYKLCSANKNRMSGDVILNDLSFYL